MQSPGIDFDDLAGTRYDEAVAKDLPGLDLADDVRAIASSYIDAGSIRVSAISGRFSPGVGARAGVQAGSAARTGAETGITIGISARSLTI